MCRTDYLMRKDKTNELILNNFQCIFIKKATAFVDDIVKSDLLQKILIFKVDF